MSVSLRVLDDGAWVSVNDARAAGVGELWRVAGFCGCDLADLIVEGVVEVGVDGRRVDARVQGQCIVCGTTSVTDWLPVGRIRAGEFHALNRESVRPQNGGERRQHRPGSTTTGKG